MFGVDLAPTLVEAAVLLLVFFSVRAFPRAALLLALGAGYALRPAARVRPDTLGGKTHMPSLSRYGLCMQKVLW